MTRSARSSGPATSADLGDGHALGEALDPYACGDCLAAGDACAFHVGFAAGWDTCMEHVTRWAFADD